MAKCVRTTTACGSCRCTFPARVCHWRMNERINTVFLLSFITGIYSLGQEAIRQPWTWLAPFAALGETTRGCGTKTKVRAAAAGE